MNITAVEIDEMIFKLAKNWFNFIIDERLKVKIADGLKFLEESVNEEKKFKMIIIDVNGNDTTAGLSCPPKEFLEPAVLDTVSKCLDVNGLFILNFVCRDRNLRPKVIENLKKKFSSVTSMKIHSIVNEILICSTIEKDHERWKKELEKSVEDLNKRVRDINLRVNDLVESKYVFEDFTIEV